jgi:thymidylate synthase (FAD)
MLAEYIDHLGTDLTVVNAARVSFNVESNKLTDKDISLIKFLANGCKKSEWDALITKVVSGTCTPEEANNLLKRVKNTPTHWTPFSHPTIAIRETVPLFVARQRFKHMVGFTYNEVSRRYVDDTPEFHKPEVWRARPEKSIKQGSGGPHPKTQEYVEISEEHTQKSKELYESMIADGVAPEQARMHLPQSMLTTYWVTGSLYAWANAYIQRSDSHAQEEIQVLAKQWKDLIEPLFPVSWDALTN